MVRKYWGASLCRNGFLVVGGHKKKPQRNRSSPRAISLDASTLAGMLPSLVVGIVYHDQPIMFSTFLA